MRQRVFESMPVRANKFREVEGGGTTWYASRTEAVGLGRVVPSSSTNTLRIVFLVYLSIHTEDIFQDKVSLRFVESTLSAVPCIL
jgi:hypothetical protein